MEKIKIIEEFLQNWKKMAMAYYTNLRIEYKEVKKTEYEITGENLRLLIKIGKFQYVRKYTDEQIIDILSNLNAISEHEKDNLKASIHWRRCQEWEKQHSKADISIISRDLDEIEKFIDQEVERKYLSLISHIEKKAGKILDVSYLCIGGNGDINGYITGEKAKVEVRTITAGGYNIQCAHYRVLVKY
jgi:hypothetical protein